MSLNLEAHGAQIDGAREYQEDAFLITPIVSPDVGKSALLVVLADGMGGHAAGNVASELAVESFTNYIKKRYFDSDDHHELLREALIKANEVLAENIRETAALKGMGCTFIGVIFTETGMQWISVGDSHLFLVRDEKLLKKNADHSYGGYLDRMAAEGNEVNDENGYSRHMLLSALTGEPIPAVDSPEQPILLQTGDQVLLASDGIDTLSREDLLQLMRSQDMPEPLCSSILAKVSAAQMPRQDNTTVVIISCPPEDLADTLEDDISLTETDSGSITQYDSKSHQTKLKRQTASIKANKSKNNGLKNYSAVLYLLLACAAIAAVWAYIHRQESTISSPITASTEIPPIVEPQTPVTPSGPTTTTAIDSVTKQVPDKAIPFNLFNDRMFNSKLAPAMVWVPAGKFVMGGSGVSPANDERPKHEVQINEFAISQNEITRSEYAQFTGKSVPASEAKLPISNLSHKQARAYTEWLSKQTGNRYRLASEAEWEYAARAGSTSPYWWGYKLLENKATCVGCGVPLEPRAPSATGQHDANEFGLIDMLGNVAEWTADCYHANYKGAPVDGSAWLEKSCDDFVVRGGSYANAVKSLQSSSREKLAGDSRRPQVGLRIVREK